MMVRPTGERCAEDARERAFAHSYATGDADDVGHALGSRSQKTLARFVESLDGREMQVQQPG